MVVVEGIRPHTAPTLRRRGPTPISLTETGTFLPRIGTWEEIVIESSPSPLLVGSEIILIAGNSEGVSATRLARPLGVLETTRLPLLP